MNVFCNILLKLVETVDPILFAHNHLLLLYYFLYQTLLYDQIKYIPSKFAMRLNVTYTCPGLNAFWLHKFRLTPAFDKFILCTL